MGMLKGEREREEGYGLVLYSFECVGKESEKRRRERDGMDILLCG